MMSFKSFRCSVLTTSITLSLVFGVLGSVGTARSVTITRVTRITGPPVAFNHNWGYLLAAAGDINGDGYADVLIGELHDGQLWLYLGSPTGLVVPAAWSFEGAPTAASAGDVNNDGFDDIIIGIGDTFGVPGQAQLYLGTDKGPERRASWIVDGFQPEERFGAFVSSAGDINGDGYDDVLVAAAGYSNDLFFEGAVYVFLGSVSGLATTPAQTIEGDDRAGGCCKVGPMGDVDGDGFDDVVFGHPNWDTQQGLIKVYLGSAAGLEATPHWSFEGDKAINTPYGNRLGDMTLTAGDVNGDGYRDLLIGDRDFTSFAFPISQGQATVTLGTPTGLEPIFQWAGRVNENSVFWGTQVAGGGDVDGDGYDDVLVSSSLHPVDPAEQQGLVRLYRGGPVAGGIQAGYAWSQWGDFPGAHFGGKMAMVGDVNGDGRSDYVIRSAYFDANGTNIGAVSLYSGCDNSDSDSVCNFIDNCDGVANTDQTNTDQDSFGDACDCAVTDSDLWSPPGPAQDLILTEAVLTWDASVSSGGTGAVFYDTLRSTDPSSFTGAAAVCLETAGSDRMTEDAAIPAIGQALSYLIRSRNAGCGWSATSLGLASDGTSRIGLSCP